MDEEIETVGTRVANAVRDQCNHLTSKDRDELTQLGMRMILGRDPKKMTPIAQQAAIANVCGWRDVCRLREGEVLGGVHISQGMPGRCTIPDYLNDLNAMHAAENQLTSIQHQTFYSHLDKIVSGNDYDPEAIYGAGWLFNTAHATAAQRAEALLKTLDLWEEEKRLNNYLSVEIFEIHNKIKAKAGQVVDWCPPSKSCPECGARGRERSGADFQRQYRCGICNQVWNPDVSYIRIRTPRPVA